VELEDIGRRIDQKTAQLAVIGLGYVGLPVACEFARAGFTVLGVDVRADRVAQINAGRLPMEGKEPGLAELLAQVVESGRLRAAVEYGELADCDVVLIAVETPVDENHRPQYAALRTALANLGPVLRPGALVVIESTIAPGTMQGLVRPALEAATGRPVNQGFFLGNCPERVMPGRLLANIRQMNRVVGGWTPATAQIMVRLYRQVVSGDLDPTDCLTAELVKTAENAYRDVQIAFANEVALLCESMGGDVWQVRDLVNKSPGRQMHLPGAGVGGHCIPKDPWLLIANAGEGFAPRLIPAARAVNDGMPLHVADLVVDALRERGKGIAGARALVLGYTYLENSDDTRNSPSADLVQRLAQLGADVRVHDPYVEEYQRDLYARAAGCDALVLMVRHGEYQGLDLARLQGLVATPILVDGRNALDPEQVRAAGWVYRGVGRGA